MLTIFLQKKTLLKIYRKSRVGWDSIQEPPTSQPGAQRDPVVTLYRIFWYLVEKNQARKQKIS